MGTLSRRRVRDGLVGLCVLALAGVAQPLSASAAPTASPSASSTGSATAGPVPTGPVPSTSTSYRLTPDAYSVLVSPARLVIGQQDLGTTQLVTVVNRGQQPVRLAVQKRNFVTAPDGGLSYRADAPYGAADWLSVSPDRLDLAPGQSEQVRASITVPPKPDAGDHQVALVFLAPPSGEGNVKVSRGVGTPIYVTVPGAVDDSVRLNSLSGPGWVWTGRPTLAASLTSTGTVHRDFRGATALDAGTPGHVSRFGDFTVSRGADRMVSTTWDTAPLICVCRPSVTVTDADGAVQTVSTRVVVLPWWLPAGLLLVAVVGLGLVLRSRYRRGRRRRVAVAGPALPDDGVGG